MPILHLILTASQISRPVYKKNMSPGNITSSMLQLLLNNCLGYYTVSRWSETVKLISIVLLYVNVTTINHAFNHSNLHLCCIYVANFIKIHRTVSKINVFKTWHLKCELSNIARASSLLPKSRSISEHFTLQQHNASAHRAKRRWSFCLAILPITSHRHRGCGHWTYRTWIRSTTKCGVCSKNACTVPGFETLTIWSSDLSKSGVTSTRELLTEHGVFDSSSSLSCWFIKLLMQWQNAMQYKSKIATIRLPVTNNVNVQITQKCQ